MSHIQPEHLQKEMSGIVLRDWVCFGLTVVVIMCSFVYTEVLMVQKHSPSCHITGHQQLAHFRKIY